MNQRPIILLLSALIFVLNSLVYMDLATHNVITGATYQRRLTYFVLNINNIITTILMYIIPIYLLFTINIAACVASIMLGIIFWTMISNFYKIFFFGGRPSLIIILLITISKLAGIFVLFIFYYIMSLCQQL